MMTLKVMTMIIIMTMMQKFVLLTLGEFPYGKLAVLHSMHVVEQAHMASHLCGSGDDNENDDDDNFDANNYEPTVPVVTFGLNILAFL